MPRWTDEDVSKLENIFYDSTRDELNKQFPDRSLDSIRRKAYRMDLERHPNIQLLTSINETDEIDIEEIDDDFANFVAGFVAGEGSFYYTKTKTGGNRFHFKVELACDDAEILHDIQEMFDCGNIHEYEARRDSEKAVIHYEVSRFGELYNRIIPFFDEYGFHSARKQTQFDEWRAGINRKI